MRNENDSKTPIDWDTFESYLAGELRDSDQSDRVRRLLDQVLDADLVLKSQGLFENEVSPDTPSALVNYKSVAASWASLKSKIAPESLPAQTLPKESAALEGPTPRHSGRNLPRLGGFRFAVRFATVAALVTVAWLAGAGKVRNNLSTYSSVYSTQAGRQASVTLPDGTDVILNVGSRLEVGGDFLTSNRSVKLAGQAQFNVRHQSGKPFLVETSTGTVKVLGTEFVVRDYAWDSLKTVSVWTGRVGVGSDIVAAGEQLSFISAASGVHSVSKAALDTTTKSFATGTLVVNDQRLEDILPELSAWYALDIKLGDSDVGNRRITGRFQLGAVSELVEVLAWTLDVRSERNGDQITLYSK